MKDIHPSLQAINKKKKIYVRSQYFKIKGLIKLDDHMDGSVSRVKNK